MVFSLIILFIKIEPLIMRTLLRKNNRNEPCKSPSPDVAAKNIIKNTTIQVQDIRYKMKKAEEKEIKLDLQSSFSQIAPSDNLSTDNKYKQIYDEYNKLKYQNKLLIDQNKQLNQENQRLTSQQQKNKNLGQLNSILLSKNQNEVLREKIIVIDDEKKRLEKSLELERQKNEQSHKNIENLRLELLFYKQKDTKGNKKVFVGSNQIQGRFILFANNLLSSYEQKTSKRIEQLGFKLNKIEMMQKIIKQQHSRITSESRVNKTPSSVKSYNWANTTVKVDSRQRENPLTYDRSDREGQKSYNSPIQQHSKEQSDTLVQRLEHDNISLHQRIKFKQSEIQRLKIDKQKLAAVIHDLQFQRKALKISTPKFNNSDDNIFKKIVTLQETVNYYQKEAEKYQSQSLQLKQYLANIEKDKLGKVSEFQLKIRENLMSQNPLSCPQCKLKNKKILDLQQQIKISKQVFDRSLIEVQGKFKNLIEDYDRKLERSQSQGSDKFNVLDEQYKKVLQLNSEMTQELSNYKMMLDYVLAKIHVPSIEGLLKDNSTIYDDLQSTFYHEREEYDKFITTSNQQILLKDQRIMQLEHSSQITKLQLKLLKQEIEHLKQINTNLQNNNVKIMKSNLNFMGRQKASKNQIFQKNNEKVIEMVRSGQEKLQILFQKINNYIHYDLVQSKLI